MRSTGTSFTCEANIGSGGGFIDMDLHPGVSKPISVIIGDTSGSKELPNDVNVENVRT
jgi:hypothetical protein